ncbi:Ig-like domain-containing protein [Marinilabilia rubra]|uniref:Thrombospondin n=1 Tax=Marinilabilia rubra TaxID=2162893 RepID=A0A2U2BB44_9BACT|nr:gliding motility-associated C-terminal domain-containing protein [Marinilabilia rubra]PWE00294.1 thrombospondin [Marinilabilia rubra]
MKNFLQKITLIGLLMLFTASGGLNSASLHSAEKATTSSSEVTANHDYISMYENGSWIISVTNNDYGLSKGISSLALPGNPAHGTAKILNDYSIIYTPNLYFKGKDNFTYKVCNTNGNCDEATVSVTVEDFDFMPGPLNDTVTYFSDSSSVFKVLVNDADLYDLPLKLTIARDLNFGFSEITNNQEIKIHFTSYFLGKDSLTYRVCDNEGDCGEATLFINRHHDASSDILIPEGFSPNKDGFNDVFRIPDFDYYTNMSLTVFNRNGILVFESSDYRNNWDGIANTGPIKGQIVPKGVYFYILKPGGSEQQFKGNLFISH